MKENPLDRPVEVGILRTLHQEGLLSDAAWHAARRIVQPPGSWFTWARTVLLCFGTALVLAGIVYFFAYNWAQMSRYIKLGLIEGGIVACVIAAHYLRKSRVLAKTLLFSASILVGVLLAVYGQIYQTGADAYGLFLAWAVLILGWVIYSASSPLWLLWLVLLNLSVILYCDQVARYALDLRLETVCLFLAGLNILALVIGEACTRGKRFRLRLVLLAASLVALSMPALTYILDFGETEEFSLLGPGCWLAGTLAGYFIYTRKLPDMPAVALIVTNACVFVLVLIGKLLFDHTKEGGGWFLLYALLIIAVVSAAVAWLKYAAEVMARTGKGGTP